MKPADAVVAVAEGETGVIDYPSLTANLHHEIELVVAIGTGGSGIGAADAPRHIWGYAVGLDMTRRDLQLALRDKGRPWELGKAFDESAPIGEIYPASQVGHLDQGAIWLQVDGADRQRSDLSKLIWSVPEVIANLSTYFTLQPGDLIYTGTPEGVGRVERGQTLHGGIDRLGELRIQLH
jgi:fumarylpyruvate hydrolase